MNSIQTKSNNYTLVSGKAIAGAALAPQNGAFIGYVAWEWPDEADNKFFAIIQSSQPLLHFTNEFINNIADYGIDVTHKKEAQALFPHLF